MLDNENYTLNEIDDLNDEIIETEDPSYSESDDLWEIDAEDYSDDGDTFNYDVQAIDLDSNGIEDTTLYNFDTNNDAISDIAIGEFDFDEDGNIDFTETEIDLDYDQQADIITHEADLNGDGIIDYQDAEIILDHDTDSTLFTSAVDTDFDGVFDEFSMKFDINTMPEETIEPSSEPEPETYEAEPETYEPEPVSYEPEPITYEPEPVSYEPEPITYEPVPVTYETETVDIDDTIPEDIDSEDNGGYDFAINHEITDDGEIWNIDYDNDSNSDLVITETDLDGDGDADLITYEADINDDGVADMIVSELDLDGDGEADLITQQVDLDSDGNIDYMEAQIITDHESGTSFFVRADDLNDDGKFDNFSMDYGKDLEFKSDFEFDFNAESEENSVPVEETDEIDTESDSDDILVPEEEDNDFNFLTYEEEEPEFEAVEPEAVNPESELIVPTIDFDTDDNNGLNYADLTRFDPSDADSDSIIGEPEEVLNLWECQGDSFRCALYSQKFVIEEYTNTEVDIEDLVDLAEDNGWFNESYGTPIVHMNKILDHYDIPNEASSYNTFEDITESLNEGHKVIVALDADEYWFGENDNVYVPADGVNHAVEVIGIDNSDPDNPMVILNDSGVPDGAGLMVPVDTFMDAWEDGNNYMIECM